MYIYIIYTCYAHIYDMFSYIDIYLYICIHRYVYVYIYIYTQMNVVIRMSGNHCRLANDDVLSI